MDGLPTPSAEARVRLLSARGEPLFLADWLRVMMMHFEVDPRALQRDVPFPLDLWNGRAFVSLVAFTFQRLGLAVLKVSGVGCSSRLRRTIS